VLAAAAEMNPVVVLVDDLHWVDQSSQRVLLFAARRLGSERVVLLMSGRDDPGLRRRCGDLPTLDLAGLGRADCARLLRGRSRPTPGSRSRCRRRSTTTSTSTATSRTRSSTW
jgi:hypothetical protein